MPSGISIVVCCHNSARLLPETLRHLSAQKLSPGRSCEVIVVDNASTDTTAAVARECWPSDCQINLRVVLEPKLGLSNARRRGFAETQYETICFVDDDNRLEPNWVEIASDIMAQHPEVGACGGQIEADCEIARPSWFEDFQNHYAVGTQSERAGDITETRGYLWGAGLCLRRRAWQQVLDTGFDFLLSGRKGAALTAGEDAEMCYALRLNGWRLWYEPRLRMSHFITRERLKWNYLRRVSRGFGAATAGIDAYELAIKAEPGGRAGGLRRSWGWQTLATIKALLKTPIALLRAPLSPGEGDADVLQIETLWGRLGELLKHRRNYLSNLKYLNAAKPIRQQAVTRE
jgi:glycosyltransferase involved in cell wall biosynthesis